MEWVGKEKNQENTQCIKKKVQSHWDFVSLGVYVCVCIQIYTYRNIEVIHFITVENI